MTFKKWQKPPKKWQKISEIEVKNEEKVVDTVVENEISDVEDLSWTIIQTEKEIGLKKSEKWEKIIWNIWNTVVAKPKGRIAFEAQVAPVPLFRLPADIRQYLINNGFSSDVYKKDKERLEKHNADMEMINRLKDFLTHL